MIINKLEMKIYNKNGMKYIEINNIPEITRYLKDLLTSEYIELYIYTDYPSLVSVYMQRFGDVVEMDNKVYMKLNREQIKAIISYFYR